MTDQPPQFAETARPGRHHLTAQKREYLLSALNRLKSDISGVEARHPVLGSELSSLCDTVIADLISLNSQNNTDQQSDRDNYNVALSKETPMPELIPASKHMANPVSSVIDRAGGHLITGLDKTGDGIIFILGKIFNNRVSKAGRGSPAEADL